MKRLARTKRTIRGFELVEFQDSYGIKCSLQASSLAEYKQPGISAIWLGCDEPATIGNVDYTRMHLKRKQVQALVNHLESWLNHGSFKVG